MSLRVLTNVIKRAVAASTAPDAHTNAAASKELAKYIRNAQTTDLGTSPLLVSLVTLPVLSLCCAVSTCPSSALWPVTVLRSSAT